MRVSYFPEWRSLLPTLSGIVMAVALVTGCSSSPAPAEQSSGSTGSGPGSTSGAGGGGSGSGCAVGLSMCGAACVDLNSDVNNCGECNSACGANLFCSLGMCSDTCAAGLVECGASCVDTNMSAAHCGGCNQACAAGQICSAGVCAGGATGSGGASSTTDATTTTTGASGGSGGSTVGDIPAGLSGVVVTVDSAGTLDCVPLCQSDSPTDDEPGDDWAYEDTYSCVLPNSPTGTRNTPCTTGEALPEIDRSGIQGVVVAVDDAGTLDCVPLCEEGAEPSSPDPENPSSYDWGWEYQATCIIRGSVTGTCNQGCITGEALPDAALVSRAGGIIDDACVAYCECDSTSADYPDWGWEFQEACVVEGSESATDLLACNTNEDQDLTPPAPGCTMTADGFNVNQGRLYDACGNEFVMRGVNNPHIWFDTGNQYLAYQALDRIATYNTNTIRVVWETSGTASLLARVLYRIVELQMVPMVELHDATGSQSNADLQAMAEYWASSDVAAVLQDFRAYALINIANEWSGSDFGNAYSSAISTIRGAGLEHTIVIDANGFGQNADTVFSNAGTLMAADSNLVFSVHMYGQYSSASAVDSVLDQAVNNSVPLVIGEFGPQLQGQNVAWQAITAGCQSRGLGYIAWSWSGNDSDTQNLNIVNDFGGSLTPQWGEPVMVSDTNSIQNTAQKAGIFQ